VIDDADVDEGERLFEASCDELVGLAGLRDAGRSVIVKEDHGGGVGLDDDARDFARIHRGAVDGAAEENLAADEAVAAIEEQEAEDLVRQRADLMAQVLTSESPGLPSTGAPGRKRCVMSAAAWSSTSASEASRSCSPSRTKCV